MKLEYRELEREDLPALKNCLLGLAEHHNRVSPHFGGVFPRSEPDGTLERFRQELEEGGSRFRGCFQNGRVVGFCKVDVQGQDGCIHYLYVEPTFWGQGIGGRLLEMALEQGRAQGCGKAVLITTNDNLKAMGFYQRRGFDMARLYRNAVDAARSIKPEIPTVGEDGIPLRHEIEFEKIL